MDLGVARWCREPHGRVAPSQLGGMFSWPMLGLWGSIWGCWAASIDPGPATLAPPAPARAHRRFKQQQVGGSIVRRIFLRTHDSPALL
jgi:hypothetical protein